jgi:uncharacterized protein YnzC (UPF0291/DUF896 family)
MTKAEIIEKIKELARAKRAEWLSRAEFLDASGIPYRALHKHFPRWNEAVTAAGLRPLDNRGRPDQKKGYSSEALLSKLNDLATRLERDYVSQEEFTEQTRISYRPINRLFGHWDNFLLAAGLRPHPSAKKRIPESALYEDNLRVYQALGRHPSYHEFANNVRFSINTYAGRRFNGFKRFRKLAIARRRAQ